MTRAIRRESRDLRSFWNMAISWDNSFKVTSKALRSMAKHYTLETANSCILTRLGRSRQGRFKVTGRISRSSWLCQAPTSSNAWAMMSGPKSLVFIHSERSFICPNLCYIITNISRTVWVEWVFGREKSSWEEEKLPTSSFLPLCYNHRGKMLGSTILTESILLPMSLTQPKPTSYSLSLPNTAEYFLSRFHLMSNLICSSINITKRMQYLSIYLFVLLWNLACQHLNLMDDGDSRWCRGCRMKDTLPNTSQWFTFAS